MNQAFTPEEFEQQLQNCLLHFYDYAYLQGNEIVNYLIPDEGVANRIQKFREHITQTIDKMQPPETVSSLARGARSYHILTLRYIEQEEIEEIIAQLAISRRQYYREHSRAITALANILRAGTAVADKADDDVFTVESEIASLRQHANRQAVVNLNNLLSGVLEVNSILAQKQGINLRTDFEEDDVHVTLDRALVRQLLLILVSTIIGQCDKAGDLVVSFSVTDDVLALTFHIDGALSDTPVMLDTLMEQQSIATLLDAIAGNLAFVDDNPDYMQLSIPLRRVSIFIIDDNPDVISLFHRLLDSLSYRLIIASDGSTILDTIKKQQVDIIILDIMLPGTDGFEILQTLKSNPDTKHLPVLICSVLQSEALAISLGADAVISKPPTKAELHKVLNQWI